MEWGITIQDHTNLSNVTIRNNIVSSNKFWQIMANYTDKGVTCDHNLINGFKNNQSETRGEDYQEGDPSFMDFAEKDFSLQETSIAINMGELLEAPIEDIIKNKRPYGNGIDIGAYEYIEPIRIDGDNDFQTTASARNWEGDGSSLATPYVIKGLTLANTANNLIEIRNTNAYFIVSNCRTSNSYFGIYLYNVTNGKISNNTVKNHQFDGIYLQNVSNCVIECNTAYNNSGVGVRVYQSNNNHILKNNLYKNQWSGIKLKDSTDNVIVNNSVHTTNVGIELFSSRRNNITSNIPYKNVYWGITINSTSEDNLVKLNDLRENGYSNTEVADDGLNNKFEFNHYEDWIGEGSYVIDGITTNQDPTPLTNPYHLTVPTITTPNNDLVTLEKTVHIQWTNSIDSYGHAIKYSIYFSIDDGNTWGKIAEDYLSTIYYWNASFLNTDSVILLKVDANCSAGYISSSAVNTFDVTSISSSTTTTKSTSFNTTPVLLILSLTVILVSRRKKLRK